MLHRSLSRDQCKLLFHLSWKSNLQSCLPDPRSIGLSRMRSSAALCLIVPSYLLSWCDQGRTRTGLYAFGALCFCLSLSYPERLGLPWSCGVGGHTPMLIRVFQTCRLFHSLAFVGLLWEFPPDLPELKTVVEIGITYEYTSFIIVYICKCVSIVLPIANIERFLQKIQGNLLKYASLLLYLL